MYDLRTIKKTLKLLHKYDCQFAKTSRETGIKARTIRRWYNCEKAGLPLLIRPFVHTKKGKRNSEQMKQVCDYYFEHGENISNAVKKFGYPSISCLKLRVKKDKRYKKPKRKIEVNKNNYSEDDKITIVKEFVNRTIPGKELAEKLGVTRETIYIWQRKLTGEKMDIDKNNNKDELLAEIEKLRKERNDLELENKILKKANELIKKEIGVNYGNLTNKEKTIVVNALKGAYPTTALLKKLKLKRSTFYYECTRNLVHKYDDIKEKMKIIFNENYKCYGYRRIKIALIDTFNVNISEKVVRRLMKQIGLFVYQKRKRKYSSYEGEISPEVPNLLNRDFKVDKPYTKVLTDITEFSLKDGKVYLSPLIDCYDGLAIVYTCGTSPNSELTNTMLIKGHEIIKNNNCTIHNDRGFHYRVPSRITLMDKFGYTRSMSKKGCSPDNSMCEGFFGTIKNEFYYPYDWTETTCSDFIDKLNKYLKWFTEKRIKVRLWKNLKTVQ